jgi:crossover junction endodeoxyribonuclease RusA
MLILELPFPPSSNSYVRHSGNRRYFSPAGKVFLGKVMRIIGERKKTLPESFWKAPEGMLEVGIELFAPTNRKYDTDNRIKPTLDALTKSGVWEDDWFVARVSAERRCVTKGGMCRVFISEYKPIVDASDNDGKI